MHLIFLVRFEEDHDGRRPVQAIGMTRKEQHKMAREWGVETKRRRKEEEERKKVRLLTNHDYLPEEGPLCWGQCPVSRLHRPYIGSYEVPIATSMLMTSLDQEILFRARPQGTLIPFFVDLLIASLPLKGGSSSSSSSPSHHHGSLKTPRRISKAAFLAAPVFPASAQAGSPWSGQVFFSHAVPISRHTTVQLVVRDAAGMVGKIFLVKLELQDMPVNSQAIIRQKHYYHNTLNAERHLQHGVQLRVRHYTQTLPPIPQFDRHGELVAGKPYVMEQTELFGTIRIVFSFNQAATIGRVFSRDTSVMQEQLHIVTDPPAYFSPNNLDDNSE